VKVLVLVGSTRAESVNARLAGAAVAHLPADSQVKWFDELDDIPFFGEEREAAGTPEVVERLRSAIAEADAVVVATPEYNASVPAILKNAIDWASRPRQSTVLLDKPVAVLGAAPTPSGAATARAHLVAILERAGARPMPTTMGVPLAHEAFDGAALRDEEHTESLRTLVSDLLQVPATA
jgi:chromate reductase, NAD(P)H dehydrogenase (quinone)